MDFKNAFDSVEHNYLLQSLTHTQQGILSGETKKESMNTGSEVCLHMQHLQHNVKYMLRLFEWFLVHYSVVCELLSHQYH